MLSLLLCMTACSAEAEFTPDYESAIGAIFVNDTQALPENTKVYADFADNSYTFDLDAACVYYFSASADVAYAGDQNFVSMTFGADLDDGTVGAEGTIAYRPEDGGENTVTAYYLYHDEQGVYFDTETYFDRMEITDQCVMTGVDTMPVQFRLRFDSRRPPLLWRIMTKIMGRFPEWNTPRRTWKTTRPLIWTAASPRWRSSAVTAAVRNWKR